MADANGDGFDDATGLPVGGGTGGTGEWETKTVVTPNGRITYIIDPQGNVVDQFAFSGYERPLNESFDRVADGTANAQDALALFDSGNLTETQRNTLLESIANGTLASGGSSGSGLASTLATIAEQRRQFDLDFAEGKRQFDTSMGENKRQFDVSNEEGRRQFNLDYNRGIQTDAAKIGLDYAQLNQNERQFVQDLAFQYYNSFNDAETGRRQALASLIQARNSNITNLAGLQADISAQWAQFAANPRDAFAEANYRAAVGGATPFGSTNNAQFGEYEQAAKDKVQQIFGPAGNMLQNAYQYATQPIPSEYLNPVQRPPELAAPKQILPPALNMPMAEYADNPNPLARALLSLQAQGANNYTPEEQAAMRQIAGQSAPAPAPAQTPTQLNQFAAQQYTANPDAFKAWTTATAPKTYTRAEQEWINGVARSKGEPEPYKLASGGTMNFGNIGAGSFGVRSIAPANNVFWNELLAHLGAKQAIRNGPLEEAAARQSFGDDVVDTRIDNAAIVNAQTPGNVSQYYTEDKAPVWTNPAFQAEEARLKAEYLAANPGIAAVQNYNSGPRAQAISQIAATGQTPSSSSVMQRAGVSPVMPTEAVLPEYTRRGRTKPFKLAEGGTLDFDDLYNNRNQPGESPIDTEGGLNVNLNERAILLTESGKILATLGERRPDGTVRREQVIVKPLKSEVTMDKKLEEQNKQAVESQKKTIAAFAEGGTIASGQGGMESIRNLLKSLNPALVPQAGQQLPDPRLLAPLYGRFQQDKDLYDLVKGAYSTQGISDNNLDYSLQQFQPRQIQGVAQTSYR